MGMIPFSVMVAKRAGFDLYTSGSKNPGASNVIRVAGWKWGAFAMSLDILKGYIDDQNARIVTFLVGIAAIAGHVFPLMRKGGKGVATGGGVAIALFPIQGVVAIIVWVIFMKITKMPVVASMSAIGVLTIVVFFRHQYMWEFILILALYILIAIRHSPNIVRMF